MRAIDLPLPRHTEFDLKIPVWFITSDAGCSIHRFFDKSAISPSGRYVAITRFEQDVQLAKPGYTEGARRVFIADTGEWIS